MNGSPTGIMAARWGHCDVCFEGGLHAASHALQQQQPNDHQHTPLLISDSPASCPRTGKGAAKVATKDTGGIAGTMSCTHSRKGAGEYLSQGTMRMRRFS